MNRQHTMPKHSCQTLFVLGYGQNPGEDDDIAYEGTVSAKEQTIAGNLPNVAAALTILSSLTTMRFHCFPPTVGGKSIDCSAGHTALSGSKVSVRPCVGSGGARVPRWDASRMRSTTRRTCRLMGWLGGSTLSPYCATSELCACLAS